MPKEKNILEDLRLQLINIDHKLLLLIARRDDLSRQIGKLKRERSIPIKHVHIEQQNLARLIEEAGAHGVDPKVVEKIFKVLIASSVRIQNKISP